MEIKTYPARSMVDAFTLIELLVVIAIIAILAAMLLPALTQAKQRGQATSCLNSMKQLQMAHLMYTSDNADRFPINGVSQGIGAGNYDWVAGSFSNHHGSLSFPPGAEVNIGLLGVNGDIVPAVGTLYGSIGGYSRAAGVYHCPADQSQVTLAGVTKSRVRSCSCNNFVGTDQAIITGVPAWVGGGAYKTFQKSSTLTAMSASDCFVFVDENPDTLDDGFFLADPSAAISPNHPAVNHGRSSAFSFADGHAARKKWRDCFLNPGSSATTDNQWLSDHCTVHN
jgi:prepilin-type N-terminal cleavage/methylation domain-containing protein/prepilin-type processing-associated H-X9-DG protein